jgi:predicted RNA-binding Zn ribbon-like protein
MTEAAQQAGTSHIAPSANEAPSLNESLALELINTETLHRGQKHDALSSPDALARWWAEVCAQYPDQCLVEGAGESIAWTGELLDAVKVLRMALRTLITQAVERQAVEAEDLRPVNEILALGYPALEPTGQGSVRAVVRPRDPAKASILFPIARSALRLFTESDWRRLHQCRHDRCIVFFYDTAKSGTRRWCSPGCMNRARSIRHYQMTKKAASHE